MTTESKVEKAYLDANMSITDLEQAGANAAIKLGGRWIGWWGCPWCDLAHNSMFFLVEHMKLKHREELVK